MIALTVISTGDTHNHKPQLYTKVFSPRENRYINVDLFIRTAYFGGGGELVIVNSNISPNAFKKLDIYQFLWDRNNRLCVILSELAG